MTLEVPTILTMSTAVVAFEGSLITAVVRSVANTTKTLK